MPTERRSLRVIAIVLLAHSALVFGSDTSPTARTNKVVASVRERLRAIAQGDRESWSRLTAEDALLVNDDGTLKGKAAVAASFPPAGQDVVTDLQNIVVRECGTAVLVNYLAREVETFPGGTLESTVRRTELWVLREGRWQALSTQGTIVPTMRWNVVTLDPKLLDEYTGQYEWYPGKVDTVTREGSHLYSRLTGDSDKDELFAINDTTFFARDDSGFTIFVRGSEGRITHYVYRRSDGQSLSARRIK
jgi:Domain of unknown function (DUF4440)/Domain of unknown function (DUF3471)